VGLGDDDDDVIDLTFINQKSLKKILQTVERYENNRSKHGDDE
jgi:hypothetical protein